MVSSTRGMRAKGQGSAVHETAGRPAALRGPVRRCTRSPELLHSGPGVMRRSDRYAPPGACTAGCRRNRTAAGRREGSCRDAGMRESPPILSTCRRGRQLTAPDHREGEGGLLCPCPRHCGGTEPSTGRLPECEDLPLCTTVPVRRERSGAGLARAGEAHAVQHTHMLTPGLRLSG